MCARLRRRVSLELISCTVKKGGGGRENTFRSLDIERGSARERESERERETERDRERAIARESERERGRAAVCTPVVKTPRYTCGKMPFAGVLFGRAEIIPVVCRAIEPHSPFVCVCVCVWLHVIKYV